MATFTFFDEFGSVLGLGDHELDAHTFKWALTNTAPTAASNTVLADITQLSAGSGYSTGGTTMASPTWAETGAGTGIWKFSGDDVVFTASGGTIGPFRYAVLYNDTHASDALVGYLDYGSNVSVTDGNTFTIDIGANGVFTLTVP